MRKGSIGVGTTADMDGDEAQDDVALMLAFQKGSEEAFVTLYRRHRDHMISYCTRLLLNQAEGEEAAQDAFIKLYSARKRYKPQGPLSTYLFRIATNHCFNLKARVGRKRRAPAEHLDEQPAPNPAPDTIAQQKQLRGLVRRAIANLPQRQGAALVLCHHLGMRYRDVAEVLGVSEGAVKSLVHRARETLVQELCPTKHVEMRHAMP